MVFATNLTRKKIYSIFVLRAGSPPGESLDAPWQLNTTSPQVSGKPAGTMPKVAGQEKAARCRYNLYRVRYMPPLIIRRNIQMKRVEYKGISCVWSDDELNFWQFYEFSTWREALDFIKSNRQNLKKWHVCPITFDYI